MGHHYLDQIGQINQRGLYGPPDIYRRQKSRNEFDFFRNHISNPRLFHVSFVLKRLSLLKKQHCLDIQDSCCTSKIPPARGGAMLGSVDIFFYSLRSSSSSVGFWKKAIQGFIASSEIRKLSCEGREFLFSSRLNNSSSGTSR